LLDGNFLDNAGKLFKLARLQRHRRVCAQPRPFIAREDPVRRERQTFVPSFDVAFLIGLAAGLAPLHDWSPVRAAFSSRPDVPMRPSRMANTSSKATSRDSSSTSRW